MPHPYASIDDVFARYPNISTLVGTGGNQVTSLQVSSTYITDAEAVIDSRLGNRYQLPLPSSVQILLVLACDFSIYNMMYERLPRVPDYMQRRYDNAQAMLEKMAAGQMVVQSATLISGGGDVFAWSNNQNFHPTFDPVDTNPLDWTASKAALDQQQLIRSTDVSSQ